MNDEKDFSSFDKWESSSRSNVRLLSFSNNVNYESINDTFPKDNVELRNHSRNYFLDNNRINKNNKKNKKKSDKKSIFQYVESIKIPPEQVLPQLTSLRNFVIDGIFHYIHIF